MVSMIMRLSNCIFLAFLSFCLTSNTQQALLNPKNIAYGYSSSDNAPSVQVDLTDLFDNRGFAASPGNADFDGLHSMSAHEVLKIYAQGLL